MVLRGEFAAGEDDPVPGQAEAAEQRRVRLHGQRVVEHRPVVDGAVELGVRRAPARRGAVKQVGDARAVGAAGGALLAQQRPALLVTL